MKARSGDDANEETYKNWFIHVKAYRVCGWLHGNRLMKKRVPFSGALCLISWL
ncbi:MAG: hypothetical protein IIZ39_09480 [Blautia sp.]|nr:hypothetical protein [Blautia sp.]